MSLKKIVKNPAFKVATNVYLIILTIFVIWMLFFDENSYITHRKFNKEIDELQKWNNYHKQKIAEDKETIKKLQDSLELERYAREKYLMKKEDEDIYMIEFDTVAP